MSNDLFHVQHHPRLASTNEEAKRLATAGCAHGTVVWADEQSAGYGRYGRTWESPAGNLMFSVVLRPAITPDRASELGFLAAVATAEVIAGALSGTLSGTLSGSGRVGLKWPNDVRIDGAKAAGILLEADSADGRLRWIVLGIGINLANAPANVAYPATCLRAHGASVAPEQGLQAFLTALAQWLPRWEKDGFPAVRDAWLKRADGVGSEVSVTLGDREERGIFSGLDASGAMLLKTGGETRRITAGDVAFSAS